MKTASALRIPAERISSTTMRRTPPRNPKINPEPALLTEMALADRAFIDLCRNGKHGAL
ncbi:MAG: hypothetical protein SOI66_05295 [Bifidobacterium sp.]|jgi:hypothetical protein